MVNQNHLYIFLITLNREIVRIECFMLQQLKKADLINIIIEERICRQKQSQTISRKLAPCQKKREGTSNV
jgi:hypothetical protein